MKGRETAYMLYSDKVGLDEWHVVIILVLEHSDHTRMVDTGCQNREKVVKQGRLLLKIESKSLKEGEQ